MIDTITNSYTVGASGVAIITITYDFYRYYFQLVDTASNTVTSGMTLTIGSVNTT